MDALEKYVHDFSEPEEELLHELDRETNLRAVAPRMISGHIQGRLLEMLVRMLRPRRALEIGTFTGYSALSMAAGLEEEAELHTVEVDDELEEFIRSYFDRSPHGGKIRLHIGSALDIAPKLGGEFDLVFIDGDKREYPAYYRMLMGDDTGRPLVESGAFLLADYILWSGKVVAPVAHNDLHTQRILEFNRTVADDPRVENVIEGYMLGAGKSYLVHSEVDTMEEVYRKISDLQAGELLEVANEVLASPSLLVYR